MWYAKSGWKYIGCKWVTWTLTVQSLIMTNIFRFGRISLRRSVQVCWPALLQLHTSWGLLALYCALYIDDYQLKMYVKRNSDVWDLNDLATEHCGILTTEWMVLGAEIPVSVIKIIWNHDISWEKIFCFFIKDKE